MKSFFFGEKRGGYVYMFETSPIKSAKKMLANPVGALLFTCKQLSFSDHVLEYCCAIGYITSLAKSAIKSMRIE